MTDHLLVCNALADVVKKHVGVNPFFCDLPKILEDLYAECVTLTADNEALRAATPGEELELLNKLLDREGMVGRRQCTGRRRETERRGER